MPTTVRSVSALYKDASLYSSKDMFSPPAERRPHVIRFELTQGCDWGRCTYCGGFDGVPFKQRSLAAYRKHVDAVWARVSPDLADGLRRIFMGGGNALAVDRKTLEAAIEYTGSAFVDYVGYVPDRIAMYARTNSLCEKGASGLNALHDAGNGFGLDLVYWGIETGSQAVLQYVRKGCTHKQIMQAANHVYRSDVESSVMIMPGLGGMRFYDSHVRDTAEVLDAVRPRFLTFMGVNPAPCSEYARIMKRDKRAGVNRPLTPKETAQQMIDIMQAMPAWDVKVGCFNTTTDKVGSNPLPFGSQALTYESEKNRICRILQREVDRWRGSKAPKRIRLDYF